MHVFVIIHDFEPGGVERIAVRLASFWSAHGVRVTVLCGRPIGALRPLLADQVSLIVPIRHLRRGPFSRLRLAFFAARAARNDPPDVIFLPGNYYAGAAPIIRVLLGARCPRIAWKVSNPLRRSDRGRVRQWIFAQGIHLKARACDHLIFMSEELRQEGLQILADARVKSSVLDEPILEGFSPIGGETDLYRDIVPVQFVAASRLVPQKNLDMMIRAMAMIENRSALLTIFGDGPCWQQLEATIRLLGLQRTVRLAGYREDWRVALEDTRLFLLSSQFEGFPAVIVEALAAGVPVVATNCSPALGSILRSSEFGTVVVMNDPAAFARAIDRHLKCPEPNRSALAGSVDRFRLEKSAPAYLGVFNRLAKPSKEAVAS